MGAHQEISRREGKAARILLRRKNTRKTSGAKKLKEEGGMIQLRAQR